VPKCCDHKFVDSKHCLKCGWVPPPAKSLLDLPSYLRQLEPDPSLPSDPLLDKWWNEELRQWQQRS